MQAVILAAGRGTRLHPITESRTKAMCPVAGKPIVERVMDPMIANGISDFILVISPDDAEIIAHFRQNTRPNTKVKLVHQTNQLGMGNALLNAAPHIRDDFLLSSCDNLVEENVISHMLTRWVSDPLPNGILTLLRVRTDELTRMGVIEFGEEQRILRIVEKPTLEEAPSDIASPPLYLFSHNLIQYLGKIKPSSRGEYELQDAIQELINNDGEVYGIFLPNRIDLTHPADLLALNIHFLVKEPSQTTVNSDDIGSRTRFIRPVYIEKKVSIGSGCRIGPNVYIDNGVVIEDNVILENCVILRDSKVVSGSQIKDQVYV